LILISVFSRASISLKMVFKAPEDLARKYFPSDSPAILRRVSSSKSLPEPPRPPEEVIWEIIQELEDSNLISEGKQKEFYSRLSTGLRQYLERRFKISALDRTTSELLNEFRKLPLHSEQVRQLKAFFESGDLVKFAKFTPSEESIDDDLDRVKKIVTETTPKKVKKEKQEVIKV